MVRKTKEIIETPTSLKQLYRYKYTDYLLKDDVDDISDLYRITQHLMPHKDINNLKEELGKKYNIIMKKYNSKVQVYAYCKQLRQLIKESKDEKTKQKFKNELRIECNKIETVNTAVIQVFELLIKSTDLRHIPIQSPQVRSSTSNRMPFSFDSRESGDE